MKRGFTLIEILAVLVLTGIIGVFAGHLVSVTIGNYFTGIESASRSQQRAVAQQRIIREINWARADSLSRPDASTLRWTSSHPDRSAEGQQSLSHADATLLLNSDPLLGDVSTFSITLGDGYVDITIDTWNGRIYPRLDP